MLKNFQKENWEQQGKNISHYARGKEETLKWESGEESRN